MNQSGLFKVDLTFSKEGLKVLLGNVQYIFTFRFKFRIIIILQAENA